MSRTFVPASGRLNRAKSGTIFIGVAALVAGLFAGPAAYASPEDTGVGSVSESTTTPIEAPADVTAETPVEVDVPADAPDEVPGELVVEGPAEPAVEPIVELPVESPAPQEIEAAAPVNLAPPVIGGNAAVGSTVTGTIGEWQNADVFTLNWTLDGERHAGFSSLPLAQAVPNKLPLTADLAGKQLQLMVEATNSASGESATVSLPTVTIKPGIFSSSAKATVSGRAVAGQVLTASVSGAVSPGGYSLGYQWYRGSAAITGAKSSKYTVTAADIGKPVSVKVSVSKAGYTTLVLAPAALTAASATFTAAPAPVISGTAKVGSKLTANPGTWSPGGATLAYQWYRGSTAIKGATGRSYTATAADNGKYVKVRVRASKSGYKTVDKYSAVKKVAAGSIYASKWPTVSGSARYGQTVKISHGWTSGSSFKYQWYKNGKAIKGGTKHYLYLGSGYIGSKISVKVTVSKSGYITRTATAKAVTVAKASITTKSVPKISGTKKAGHTLTASAGTYSPKPSSYGYQWYRNGKAISGAKYRTYKLTSSDNGKKITVKVSARKTNYYTRAATSAAVSIPMPPRTVISRDGIYRVGSSLKPGLYKATGTGDGCYWETVSGFSGDFDEINANYFGSARTYVQITSSDVGFETSGCGKWTTAPTTGANASKITADGTYRVGVDIKPGTYYGYSSGNSCYWATLSGFTESFDDLIDNHFGSARVVVTIPASAKGFTVSNCGTLTRK